MTCSPFVRTALLAVLVLSTPISRAAEPSDDDDDEKPVATGRVRDAGTRKRTPEIAPASDEPVQALKRMKLPPGLEVKLWAAEPMLANPVAFNFDERGRIFVAETYRYRSSVLDIRDYMWMLEDELACRTVADRAALIKKAFGSAGEKELSIEGEILRLVEDTDGDGVADKSHVYADGFNTALDGIASGVLARRGKVWFTNIPNVWQFTGDTKAATRNAISTGYGVRFNFTGHDLHGLVFGPDGELYFSNGDRGATVKTKEGRTIDTADMGAVFRCNPDGTEMELFATGLRNPQSLVFNEYGDLLTGDNDCDNGDEERLVHVVENGDSGWRIGYQFAPLEKAGPWNTEKLWWPRHEGQLTYHLAPICNIEDGPSGIEYNPGTGLSPDYSGTLFITHFKGSIARSGIYTYNLKQKGASYEVADAKPFLTSALPTDVKFGPDGRLYTSDWAEGWPKSKRGRIYAMSDPKHEKSALTRETQQLIGGDWTKRPAAELARLLGHPDWRVRLEAQFTLVERGGASVATLADIATKADAPALARRHASWGLGQLAPKNRSAFAPLRLLVRDRDPEMRAQAVKLLGNHGAHDMAEPLIGSLLDENNRVKFFAAQSLGRLSATDPALARRAAPALIAAIRANNDDDYYLRHALVMGLVGGKNLGALEAASTDSSRAVRLAVVLAYRRLGRAEIAKFLSDSDPLIAREAAVAINDAPIPAAMPALAALIEQPLTDEPTLFRVINAHFRLGKPDNARALAAYAVRAEAPARGRAEALAQLALWPKPPQRDRLVGIFRPLPDKTRPRKIAVAALEPMLAQLLAPSSPSVVQVAALKALQTLEIAGATDALLAAVSDEKQLGPTRAAALAALDKIKHPRLQEAVNTASTSSSPELRLAALPITARLSPDAAAPVLANLVRHGDVAEQKAALRALGHLRHPTADAVLAEQLQLLADGKVAPAVQLELLTAAGRRRDPKITQLLAQREVASASSSADPLAPYRVALAGGNPTIGKRIFETQPVMACIRCHRAGEDGGDAGPDLADAGAKYSREYLLESIVKPNVKIAPGFDTIVLTLKTGGVVAGIVTRETDDMIALRDPDNKVVEVKKENITKREGAPSSMPEIYATILTKSQLRDVVEYVASLKERTTRVDETKPRALRGLPTPKPAE
ncbi:MAG: HEAT repeat domain-containing protein [Opitutaceae bacterium]|nr:HEAT repeat domain-containing protein [Opitutaceae bacterium]